MLTATNPTQVGQVGRKGGGPGWRFTEWLFGIAGGIGVFLGVFILFADANEYVGIGGDWSWRVGDISAAWTYSLLIGGAVLLLASLSMVAYGRKMPATTPKANKPLADLYWHSGIFVLVNAYIWVQDFAISGGLDYAYWVTVPWAVGLGVHSLIYRFNRARGELPTLPPEQKERELQHL